MLGKQCSSFHDSEYPKIFVGYCSAVLSDLGAVTSDGSFSVRSEAAEQKRRQDRPPSFMQVT